MKGNMPIPNQNSKKDIQKKPRVLFNVALKKEKKMKIKQEKIKKMWPRPSEGPLKPIVRCPTNRYNMKTKLGRGFTVDELKAADIDPKKARRMGISVDLRRTNKSLETFEVNKERLLSYMSRFVKLTRKDLKTLKNKERDNRLVINPKKMDVDQQQREVTAAEKEFNAYLTLKKLRGEKHVKNLEKELKKTSEW